MCTLLTHNVCRLQNNSNKNIRQNKDFNLFKMYLVNLCTSFFKKTAHAYFERPYFSKSFGGKI